MQKKRTARHPNLSAEVASILRDQLVSGEIPADERLNEVHIAEELDVSRTPVREALSQLVAEGFVTSIPRRGFFAKSLTAADLDNLYKIRAILDPAALRLAGLPSREQIDRLEEINRQIAEARGASRIVDLDDRWHLELIAHCSNDILLELIEQFIRRTRRYELAYMNESKNTHVALDEHERIIRHLRAGDLEAACQALYTNLQSAVGPLLAWLGLDNSPEESTP